MATAAGNVGFVERLMRADPSAAVSPNAKVRCVGVQTGSEMTVLRCVGSATAIGAV